MEAIAPGRQGVLFLTDTRGPLTFTVLDAEGFDHTRTTSLGFALTAARHVAERLGEAWIVASDGATARLIGGRISSAFSRPWITTITNLLEEPT